MKIVDCWVANGSSFAYCKGEDIGSNFTCSSIIDNAGNHMKVDAIDVSSTIQGGLIAVLKFSGRKQPALGDFEYN